MHGSLYLLILVFAVAGAVELYYRWRNPHPISTIAIAPCPICGANAELDGVGQDTFVRCLSHNCAMQGPYGKDEIAAVKAWNAIPSMTTVVAWQFQAAGAALALQRLVDSGQSLRNAQYLAARISSFCPAAIEVGEEFDTALDDARAAIGGNHA